MKISFKVFLSILINKLVPVMNYLFLLIMLLVIMSRNIVIVIVV